MRSWPIDGATTNGRFLRDILTPMIDKTTKILLILIALGLWANAVLPLIRPHAVAAQSADSIENHLSEIESDVHKIARGTCTNGKIC
jgi:hypothetical protein